MKDLLNNFVPSLRALVVALSGVVIAQWWIAGDWLYSVGVVVGLVALGFVLEALGEKLLPERPSGAAGVMEWWVLAPMGVAVGGSAAVIIIALELAVPESVTDPAVKQTTAAVATALTSFVSAVFVASIGDRDKSAVGNRIKERMRRHYTRDKEQAKQKGMKYLEPDSPAEQLLYSDLFEGLSGWDRETRSTRAARLAEEIK